jgi:nucleoside-diphosphate-sugar epimerase
MKLVTGATGFLGAHVLLELVSRGDSVKALYRDKRKIPAVQTIFSYYHTDIRALWDNIEWITGDILDYFSLMEHFMGVTEVYHTAGYVSFRNKDRQKLQRVNVLGTANVVNACLELGIEKLCHVSSIAALGESDGNGIIDENMLWNPGVSASAYAISKLSGEMEVWRGIHEGLQALIVNPSVIIGPGMWWGTAGRLLENIRHGLRYYPEGSSGYVDVRDVAAIMVKLLNGNFFGERFIINAENLHHRLLFNYLADAMDSKHPDRPITPALIKGLKITELIRSLLTGQPPRISSKTLEIANEELGYSNKKIKDTIEIDFIPIQESVKFSIAKYLTEASTSG